MSHYVTASSEFVMCSVAVLGSLLLISSSVHTITSSTPSMQPRLVAFAFFALLLVASIDANEHMAQQFQVQTSEAASTIAGKMNADFFQTKITGSIPPRFGFVSSLGVVVNDSSQATSYGIGIGIQAAYGLILAILTILVGCCFCWCRCCCNWCGSREPIEGGYTKCQRWGTFTLMLIFTLGVTFFAIVGWSNNIQISTSAVSDSGAVRNIADLLQNTAYFLVGSTAAIPSPTANSGLSQSLTGPGSMITGLNTSLASTISSISGTLTTVQGTLTAGVNGLLSQIVQVNNTINTGLPSGCSVCIGLASQTTTMSNNAVSQSQPPLQTMNTTVANIQNNIISASGGIYSNINSMVSAVKDVSANTVQPQYNNFAGSYQTSATQYDNYRNIVMLVIFIIPVTSLLFMFCGCCMNSCKNEWSGCPFTLYYWVGYLGSFLVFLMLAIHLPLAVVFSDTCTYLNSIDSNFASVSMLSSGSAGAVLDSCMQNTSLTGVYNLSTQLNAITNLQFGSVSVASSFSFSSIDTFTATVKTLQRGNFSTGYTNLLSTLNGASCTSTSFTVDFTGAASSFLNCPTDTGYTGSVQTCVDACDAMIWFDGNVTQWVTNVQSQSNTLNTTYATLRQTMIGVDQTLNVGVKNIVSSLVDSVWAVLNNAKCGFIGVSYRAFKANMCNKFASALSMIALCTFAIGIINFAVIVCSTVLAKRMPNPKSEDAVLVVELGAVSGLGGMSGFGNPISPMNYAIGGSATNVSSITIAPPTFK